MKKRSITKYLENNQFLTVFALVIAVLLYIAVAMTTNDTISYTVNSVPVSLDIQAAQLTALGLEVIEETQYTVDITVNGPRTIVGQLTASSPELATTVRLTDVTEPGTQTLQIISAYTGTDLDFEIIGYSPQTLQVRFDRLRTSTFEIKTITKGVSSAPGYVYEGEEVSPDRVTVTGPEADVSRIASAEVSLELTEALETTLIRTRPIVLRDNEGEIIDPEEHHLSLDVDEAQVIITVLKETGLPIEVGFTSVPRGLSITELLQYMGMSEDYVIIRGPADIIDSLTEIRAGYIDLKELSPDRSTFEFNISQQLLEISDQLRSTDNVTSIAVYFDIPDWETASFNVRGIETLNVPSDKEVELRADHVDNVTFTGIKEELDAMTVDDIVAEIDLSDRVLTPGQHSLPVKFSVPGRGLVWALGDYTVVVNVTEKE